MRMVTSDRKKYSSAEIFDDGGAGSGVFCEHYLWQLLVREHNGLMNVFAGMRRSGKSCLMNTESQEFHRAVGFEEANRIVAYVRKI